MLSILAVNVASIVVGIVVAVVLVGGFGAYVINKILAKKQGKSSCGCSCSSCAYCKQCHSSKNKLPKDRI